MTLIPSPSFYISRLWMLIAVVSLLPSGPMVVDGAGCVPYDWTSSSGSGGGSSSCEAAYPNNQCWTHNSCTNAFENCLSSSSPCQRQAGCQCSFAPRFCAANSGCGIVSCEATNRRRLSDAFCYDITDRDLCVANAGVCRWSLAANNDGQGGLGANDGSSGSGASAGAIVGGCLAALAVIGLAVGIFLYSQQRRNKSAPHDANGLALAGKLPTPSVMPANHEEQDPTGTEGDVSNAIEHQC